MNRQDRDFTIDERRRGVVWIVAAATLLVIAIVGAEIAFLSVSGWGSRRDAINPNVFADGIGIYVLHGGKYNLLVWKKKIVSAPGAVPEPRDIAEAAQQALVVDPGVRFFAYGLDFSKWQAVPPYEMAFCILRDERTVDGIYPVRLKPLDSTAAPVYELLLPTVIDNLKSGALPHLFWVLNFQYSCNDGWTFRFARNR